MTQGCNGTALNTRKIWCYYNWKNSVETFPLMNYHFRHLIKKTDSITTGLNRKELLDCDKREVVVFQPIMSKTLTLIEMTLLSEIPVRHVLGCQVEIAHYH